MNTLTILWKSAKRLTAPRWASLGLCVRDIPSSETDPTAGSLAHLHSLHQQPASLPPLTPSCPPGSDLYVYSGFLPASEQRASTLSAVDRCLSPCWHLSANLQPWKVTEESCDGCFFNQTFSVQVTLKGHAVQGYETCYSACWDGCITCAELCENLYLD